MKRLGAAWIAAIALLVPASASASPTSVFAGHTISGNAIPCTTLSDGVRSCHGSDGGGGASDLRLKSFDGSALEVYVILPPGAGSDYPLIVQSHGWGGTAGGPSSKAYSGPTADAWAKAGYAVLQLTARGFGDSCGTAASRLAAPLACLAGYIRLDDDRYEVRDIQYATGLLVDESLVDPAKIGATGPSYGGGVSLQLATLKDRVMNADGSLSAWKSPNGTPIHLAAAAPVIPWSDLAYSLMPNGRTLDYTIASPTADLSPIGVEKMSFVSGLYALGTATGYYSTPGLNPQADLTTWFGLINAGEPYDSNPAAQTIVNQIARYHSAYYLLDGAYGTAREAPSPLLIANGFTDDLFPVDEALRYYNLERSQYPSNPIALFDFDGGHPRGQNKPVDTNILAARIMSFLEHYVGGSGPQPQLGATAMTQTCPKTAASAGPFTAASWAALHPGEVDFSSAKTQTILSGAGDPAIGKTIDPIAGGGACATAPAADQSAGVASYRLPAARRSGYTLLGSPTVIADLQVTGLFAEVAERLWDVDPKSGTETLVARGLYRIDPAKPDGLQVFQLHPGAWHFAAGHIPKLELLAQDIPYARAANGAFTIAVSNLQLRLPVHEKPGSTPPVGPPKPPVTPKPHPCLTAPLARVTHTVASRHGFKLSGTASELQCSGAAQHPRLTRVMVVIMRLRGHRQVQFVRANGTLTGPRSLRRLLELRARGTKHWTLRVRGKIPAGRYEVAAIAFDSAGHHQLRSAIAFVRVR
jgi:dienelactone hydrolase